MEKGHNHLILSCNCQYPQVWVHDNQSKGLTGEELWITLYYKEILNQQLALALTCVDIIC